MTTGSCWFLPGDVSVWSDVGLGWALKYLEMTQERGGRMNPGWAHLVGQEHWVKSTRNWGTETTGWVRCCPTHPGSGLKQKGLQLTLLALALLMSSGVTAHKVQQGILVVTTGVTHDHAAESLAIHLLELTLDKVKINLTP